MCVIVPDSFTAVVSACDPLTGLYTITGQIQITDPPGQLNSGTSGYVVFGTTCSGGGSSPYVVPGPFPDVAVVTIPYTIINLIANGPIGCTINAEFYNNDDPLNPVVCTGASLEFLAAEPCFVDFRYYEFTNCCTQEVLSFGPGTVSFITIAPGTYLYTGAAYQGLEPNTCYTVANASTQDAAYYGTLPIVPANSAANYTSAVDCNDTLVCPGCEVPCYKLYSCDGSILPFNTNTDLFDYIGEFVEINLVGGPSLGCFYVQPSDPIDCSDAVVVEVIGQNCNCECTCYTIVGEAKGVHWLNCDTGLIETIPLTLPELQICSSVYPIVFGPIGPIPVITDGGLCVTDPISGLQICLQECFELIDCDGIQDPIYTTKPSLGPYAILGQVVIIDGYPDTCWIVNSVADCECAIDVVVLQSYPDCITCKNPSKYKLINCADSGTIVYTSSDLSAYVGQVIIRGECPGCWLVEEIEDIPSDVIVTVTVAYIDCVECAREYYQLVDCTGLMAPIITYTDLSDYIGSVIKLKYCPETCWTVNITQVATNAGIVIPETEYADCPECLRTLPCICTTVRNDSDIALDYRYYDCDIAVQQFTLQPGETSPKFCIRAWSIYFPDTDYIVQHGDCTHVAQDPWECPPEVYPRRSVQPGYNTPACTADKYEKISCKSAEVYYNQVLYLRYGISSCCLEDTDKWLIKKELIDMDALLDPNWVCTASSLCCPNTPICSGSPCGCITPSATCNSQ